MFAGIRNGRASGTAMQQALALDAGNPRVVLVDAFGLHFRPKIAGGDKIKACGRFCEAGAAFDRAGAAASGDWGPAEAHFWLGRCLLDVDNPGGAELVTLFNAATQGGGTEEILFVVLRLPDIAVL